MSAESAPGRPATPAPGWPATPAPGPGRPTFLRDVTAGLSGGLGGPARPLG